MFVRCERCRAVYEIEGAPGVVACGRCEYVFVPRAVERVFVAGLLGGAAADRAGAITDASPSADLPRIEVTLEESSPTLPASEVSVDAENSTDDEGTRSTAHESTDDDIESLLPRSGGFARLAPVALGLLIVGGATFWLLSRPGEPAAVAPSNPALEAALVDLRRDDLVSIEKAKGALASLAETDSVARGWHAVAVAVEALAYEDEARDESGAVQRATLALRRRQAAAKAVEEETGKAPPPDPRIEVLLSTAQAADARRKIAAERSDRLLALAAELVRTGEAGDRASPVTTLASAIVQATRGDGTRLAALRERAGAPALDPWFDWAKGLALSRGSMSAGKAREANAALGAALERMPDLVRARIDLARVALGLRPPALDEAAGHLDAVAESVPQHEGRGRLARLIQELRAEAVVASTSE